MSAALWLGLDTHVISASALIIRADVTNSAGSYSPTGRDYGYRVRWGTPEHRNWFIFELPTFPSPLVRAELRLDARQVWPTNVTAKYELHPVTIPFEVLTNYGGDISATFNDLGDGPVLAERTISTADGYWYGQAAIVGIQFNPAGLDELTSKQGGAIALGGRALSASSYNFGYAFDGGYLSIAPLPIQLVLYFSTERPPEVMNVGAEPSLVRHAGQRVTLHGVVSGKEPMQRHWTKNGVPIANATNEILDIRSTMPADAGTYRLIGSNELGTASSEPLLLNVAALTITRQPIAETNLLEGAYLSLSVTVSSTLPVSYQWRKNGTNLLKTLNPLGLGSLRLADAGTYDVVVYNSAGSVTSQSTRLIVEPIPPVFYQTPPQQRALAVGLPLDILFYFSGGTPTDFQWYRGEDMVPGAVSNRLLVTSIGFNDAGDYWLVGVNSAGRATSSVVQVSVVPLLISNLPNATVLLGNSFSYRASVQGAGPTWFQWFFNGAPLSGMTNDTLLFSAINQSDSGSYFVVASNYYGAATSTVSTISVVTQAPRITTQAYTVKSWIGEDISLSVDVTGGPLPALQWFFNDQPLNGQTQAVLQLTNVSQAHTGPYRLRATNLFAVSDSPPITLTVLAEAPFFIRLPRRTNALAGTLMALRSLAIAGPPPLYQWRKNGIDLPGATNNVLQLGPLQLTDTGVYEVVARNALGEVRYPHRLNVTPSTALDRWQWQLPKPQGSRLHQVASEGGRYVAGGNSGLINTSHGGHNWHASTIAVEADFEVVACGNNVFLAAARINDPLTITNLQRLTGTAVYHGLYDLSGIILVSTNGTNWSATFLERDYFEEIAFGSGRFVAVGANTEGFYTSTDGSTWTRIARPSLYSVVFGNGRFLAGATGVIHYSLDGLNWIPTTAPNLRSLSFADNRFFALDWTGVVAESVDGITWLRLGNSWDAPTQPFVGAGGKFIGKTSSSPGHVLYSSDGVTWSPIDTGTRQEIESIISANGEFLGVGEAGTITRSIDGLFWTPNEVANKIDYYGLATGPSLAVAVGDAGSILVSSNGSDWVERPTPTTRNLHAVAYGNGMYVAGGRGGTIITSPDAFNWTARISATDKYIERIAWGDGLWVAVTEQGDITTSSDAIHWTATSTGPPLTDHEGVAFGGGVWMVVGGYFGPNAVSTIFSRTNDSPVWTPMLGNVGKRLRAITYGRGRFVAVGNDGVIVVISNRIVQIWNPADQNLRAVCYANGRFIAVGNDGTLFSSAQPERSWTKHDAHTSLNLHDIIVGPNGSLLAAGNNGMLIQSTDTRPRFLGLRPDGKLEFDPGIASNLRLEYSADLRTWDTHAQNATSPLSVPIEPGSKFWRLKGD